MISRMTAVLLVALIAHVAVGEEATSPQEQWALSAAADEAMRSGNFAAAITALEELVADTTASTSRDLYNLGVARYRQGDFGGASEAFGAVDDRLAPEDLRAAAAYNKGTAVYQHVMETLGNTDASASTLDDGISGLDDAMESLESGLEEYRRSLAFDPTNGDAAANAQMTWEAIAQLESLKNQLEEQQQDQQDQQEQNQQQQDQQEQDQQQGSQGETASPQEGDRGDAQQEEVSPSSEDATDQEQADLETLLERARQAREQLEEHLESHPEDEQAQTQLEAIDEAIEQLQKIQEELNDDTTSGEGEDAQDRPSIEDLEAEDEGMGAPETGTPANDREMSPEEARRLLQGVRDREHARRDDLASRRRAHQLPVERDW